MGITSTDNQTAEAPIVEAPVASKTASPPTTESEPAPTETSKPVSRNAATPRNPSVEALAPRALAPPAAASAVAEAAVPCSAHRLRTLVPDICGRSTPTA